MGSLIKSLLLTITWSFVVYFSVIAFNIYQIEQVKRHNEKIIQEYKDRQKKIEDIKKHMERVRYDAEYVELHRKAKYMTGF